MSDEELDAAIAERFKAYEAGMHLPDEFKGRFVSSMRRKRTVRRIWMLGLIGIMVIACVVILNCPAVASSDVKPTLMATTAPTNETDKVSYLILLSYLRECFIRSKSARRKEEE
jgi:hypothetical protein